MANGPYPKHGSHTPEARAQREAHWREVLARWKRSGLSNREFSRQEGLSKFVLTWWGREIRRRDRKRPRRAASRPRPASKRPPFIPVRVVRATAPASRPVEVVVLGRVIRVLPDFDPETFRRIVHVLEGWPTLAEVQEGLTC